MQDRIPLCVDLDGTPIRSSLLVESALSPLSRNPLFLFQVDVWLVRGKAHLKREIGQHTSINVTTLPYEPRMLDWLRNENSVPFRGRWRAPDDKRPLGDVTVLFESTHGAGQRRGWRARYRRNGQNPCNPFVAEAAQSR